MKKITTTFGLKDDYQYALYVGYSNALAAVGGKPLPISSIGLDIERDIEEIDRIAKDAVFNSDAVMICGGLDVDPSRYGEAPSSYLSHLDRARDQLEIAVIQTAIQEGKKVLAICRGMQILNVALGGTLHQDLESIGIAGHAIWDREAEVVHPITIDPKSELAKIATTLSGVNSLHHQGIKDLSPSLKASAWSQEGLIEAVETEGVIGVQWHPERLFSQDSRNLALFEWLVG
ncbi:MAG: gamma-glutamyl-gamma-aminobutyrate hydrolase family protein [Actinomycetota bacterium]|nr:gamma-glutamyl-gamma-aminobutyrate hydrolase family protein [Actinomycetota bacterium]